MITRRQFLQTAALVAGLGLGAGAYTWRWEPHWLEIIERRLPLASLPPRLKGARLVQLSDLHIGRACRRCIPDAYVPAREESLA